VRSAGFQPGRYRMTHKRGSCIRPFLSSCGRGREVPPAPDRWCTTVLPGWDARAVGLGWSTGNDGSSRRTYHMRKGRNRRAGSGKPAAPVPTVTGIDAAITARHHIALRDFSMTEPNI
jgi:hypothetical protein